MAKFRQVHIDFWQDAFVLDLTPEEKYFYVYLMTNSKTSQCGIYELPKKVIETETGYNRETVDKLLQRFIDYDKIAYSEKTKEIMMKNWIKYNFINSPKVVKCIEKELENVKEKGFVRYYNTMAKRLGYRINTLSIDLGEEEEKEEEQEKEEKNKKPSRPKQVYDKESVHYKLASRLYQNILKNNPDHKQPNLQKWANDVRLMMENDNRTEEQIIYLMDWCQNHSFWKSNILSTSKLREKFDQLVIRVKEEISKQNKSNAIKKEVPKAYQSLQDWADEV